MEAESCHRFGGYSQKLISILEVVGSYFVDVFFNHVYLSAKTSLKSEGSLVDEFSRRVQSYIVGVKTDKHCYLQVVQNLYRYFQTTTVLTSLTFADFVERVVQQFIPAEYYGHLTCSEKDETLGSIVVDLVSRLGAYVTSPGLIRQIVDEHDRRPQGTIRKIQDQGVTFLLTKRGEIYNSFVKKIGQTKDTVSVDVVAGLRQTIRKLLKQKAELKAQLGETGERVLELEEEIKAFSAREERIKKTLMRMLRARRDGEHPAEEAAAGAPAPSRPPWPRGAAPPRPGPHPVRDPAPLWPRGQRHPARAASGSRFRLPLAPESSGAPARASSGSRFRRAPRTSPRRLSRQKRTRRGPPGMRNRPPRPPGASRRPLSPPSCPAPARAGTTQRKRPAFDREQRAQS